MSYSSEVLADSPLAYWRLDETSGTTAADASGNGRDFTLVDSGIVLGAATVMPTGVSSFDFPGTIKQVKRAYGAWMDAASFTFEAWVSPDRVSSYNCIISRDNTATTPRGPSFYILDGKLILTGSSTQSTTTLAVGASHHVVVTYDAPTTTTRFYLDGAPDGVASGLARGNVGEFDLFLGSTHAATSGLNFPFDGRIDEVAYYGTALSAARIAAHYAAGTSAGSISLSLAATLPRPTASLAFDYTPPSADLSIDATLPGLAADLAFTVVGAPDFTLAVDATLPAFSTDAVSVWFDYDPPVATPPPTYTPGRRVEKAAAYPMPVLENGRIVG